MVRQRHRQLLVAQSTARPFQRHALVRQEAQQRRDLSTFSYDHFE